MADEHMTSNLVTELRSIAQNEYMIDQNYLATGHTLNEAADEIERLRTGLGTIQKYTGAKGHPNGKWDAHVIAGRLLRGEDQNGRRPADEPGAEHVHDWAGIGDRCGPMVTHVCACGWAAYIPRTR